MLRFWVPALLAAALAACSVKRTAVDIVGDAISGGSGVYASDDDPDLVREAIPFGLKTYESLLAVSPDHPGLLLAAASGFVGYAYLLEQEADEIAAADPAAARAPLAAMAAADPHPEVRAAASASLALYPSLCAAQDAHAPDDRPAADA